VERIVGVVIVEHRVDLWSGERLAADLATFHAQDSSNLPGLLESA
jgi:carbonic anhydrase/acetyltransferase-like protein (isoleucine patch superfamily)